MPEVSTRARQQDPNRHVKGKGRFLDDVDVPNLHHAAFLRSPIAHARVVRVDAGQARNYPGVVGVYTSNDLGPLDRSVPCLFRHEGLNTPHTPRPLAATEVCHVGQTIAMVIAQTRYLAEDALDAIQVDFEPLPAVADVEAALRSDAALVGENRESNVVGRVTQAVGDVGDAFRAADHVFRRQYVLDRSAAMPMETRGVVATFDPRSGHMTVWASTQAPFIMSRALKWLLGLDDHALRVIVPDTGGGFGVKGWQFYPEEILVPWAAMTLGVPVKWVEDRLEHFVGSNHERRQIHNLELAATAAGDLLGLRDNFIHDTGAFATHGLNVPLITASQIAGLYRVPNLEVTFTAVYTNTRPTSPYRGAGRVHSCFALERGLDHLADELGLSRIDIRRRNFIQPDEFPYDRLGLTNVDGTAVIMDSGNYDGLLSRVSDVSRYVTRRAAPPPRLAAGGKAVGVGLACYAESGGFGPYEGARVRVDPSSGKVSVALAVTNQGQAHVATFAHVAALALGVTDADVVVTEGDTATLDYGFGTFASRGAVVAGNAVALAAGQVKQKAIRLASDLMEANPDDIELSGGNAFVRGSPHRGIPLMELARVADPDRYTFRHEMIGEPTSSAVRDHPRLPMKASDSPGLDAIAYFSPKQPVWGSGAHVAVVEVDVGTGAVKVLEYYVVHDCGVVLNAVSVDGQVSGGVAQGIGGAFYERIIYDQDGQLRNGSFMDFLIPFATEIPDIRVEHLETPSPFNPLGVKGVGEGGALPVPAVMASAIEDALKSVSVRLTHMPIEPAELYAIMAAERRKHLSVEMEVLHDEP